MRNPESRATLEDVDEMEERPESRVTLELDEDS